MSSVVRELRAVQRFALNLPVQISWRAADRPVETAGGCTRDLSTRGMFVLAPAGPREGELLRFEIDMALDESSPLLRVEGEGRVVRVEYPARPSPSTGFAVRNLWFKLRDPKTGAALSAGTHGLSAAAASVTRMDQQNSPRRLTIAPPNAKPSRIEGELT